MIEQQLAASDPDFVQSFRSPVRRSAGDVVPRVLLLVGLVLVAAGAATVAALVAALGTAVILAGLVLMPRPAAGPGPAI